MDIHNFKTTEYFKETRLRKDRALISTDWIIHVINNPVKKIKQKDGRYRLWGIIEEMDNRYLRVILLEDGKTVHNAFFDRSFKP